MDKIYHVSKTSELKILQPRICSHGIPLVYGSKIPQIALLFGGRNWSDFDFILRYKNPFESITICETYPGAFYYIFKNQKCSLYELENSGFDENKTTFSAEIVSKNPTKIIKETKICDLKQYLQKEIDSGYLKLYRYSNTPEYKKMVNDYITHLCFYSDYRTQPRPKRLEKLFGNVIKEAKNKYTKSPGFKLNDEMLENG